jgi:2-iminobutanoate/2-iminopropanoate deaminase
VKKIVTNKAPKPSGHYSQAIVHNDVMYVSGQLPIKPGENPGNPGTMEEQTVQVIKNLEAILVAGGSGLDKVIKTTVYISDISLWSVVNEVYSRYFDDHLPARAVVPTRELHFGYQIEMDAIAALT